MKYAWFTVGMPESTPQEVVRELKKEGYQGVEWRVTADDSDTDKPGFWKGNRSTLQESWSHSKFKEIADITADAGLEVPNLGTYVKAQNIDMVERMMAVAGIFNAPSIRVGGHQYDESRDYNSIFQENLENFARVAELSKKYNVRALIEMHHGTITPSASAAHRLVSNFSADHIGVIHDAGNMVHEGYENYKMGFEILGPYLAHVHIKNGGYTKEKNGGPQVEIWKSTWAPLRKGAVDFTALVAALRKTGYDGWFGIEDFSLEENQTEKVCDAIRFLKEVEEKAEKALVSA